MMQDGQTATNPQTGEKVVLRGGQWVPAGGAAAPAAPPYIAGPPKQIDPAEQARLGMAEQDQQRQNTLAPYQIMTAQANATNAQSQQYNTRNSHGDKLRDDYNQDASVKAFTRALPPYMASLKGDSSPASDLALTYAFATMMDPQSSVREGEQQMQSTGDTIYGQTVARLKKELGDGGSFRPEYRAQLLRQMRGRGAELRHVYDSVRRDFEGRAQRSGINPADVLPADPASQFGTAELDFWAKNGDKDAAVELQKRSGGASGSDGMPHDGPATPTGPRGERLLANDEQVVFAGDERPVTVRRNTPEQEAQIIQAVRDGDLGQTLALLKKFSGNEPTEDTIRSVGHAIAAVKRDPKTPVSIGYGSADAAAQDAADAERFGDNLAPAMEARKNLIADPLMRGAADTGSFGTADELAAGVSTLFSGGTMKANLQRERAIDEADRRVNGRLRLTGQVIGGVLNPIGRGATAPGEVARAGGVGGALYGFGSGEGTRDRAQNALLSGVGGAAGGYAVSKTVNALASGVGRVVNAPGRVAGREARAAEMAQANDVAGAAQSEGVRVSRGVLDPRARNDVTRLETTQGGGAAVRGGLDATRSDIEAGVNRLGRPGSARDEMGAGEAIQDAGRRFITKSKRVVDHMYDRARQLGGNTSVKPAQALSQIDNEIADLSQNPKSNTELINYLTDLRSDISRDGVTIDSLRSLRSSMRGQINTRNLTATDAERRVKGVLDAASQDIGASLAGNPAAAAAYQRADSAFREKQQYITDVVQRFIGRRDQPMSAEQAFAKFSGMAKPTGDSRRLAEMMRSLKPDEAADMAATFADKLGRNNAGDFTAPQLVSQAEKLSDRAKLTIFGPQGKESLDNLVKIARELKATQGNLNHSRTAVAQNTDAAGYRGWLAGTLGLLGGAGTGFLQGGVTGGAIGATIGGTVMSGAAKGAQRLSDKLSAKALMSPEITKWLANAPRTTSPAAINAHIKRLGGIAARNPQLAAEVSSIEQMVMGAIRQLPQGAAAQGQRPTASNPNAGQNQ